MKNSKFETLVPQFFCALGKFYEQHKELLWDDLYHIVLDLLKILARLHKLEKFEDFKYGLDDLVSPLLEEFINNVSHPKALNELSIRLTHVRAYLGDELRLRESTRL